MTQEEKDAPAAAAEIDDDLLDDDGDGATEEGTEADDGAVEGSAALDGEEGTDNAPQPGEIQVTIGDDNPEDPKSPKLVKRLRRLTRDQGRELRALRQQLNASAVVKAQDIGPKPTLESCGWKEAEFEAALDEWKGKKKAQDDQAAAARAEEERINQSFKARVSAYEVAKTALGAPDYKDAESVVIDLLDVSQQGIIVQGAKDAALLIYALGKNEEKARELAAIKNPVEFAFAVARLEGQLKVTGKKPATKPEGRIAGSGHAAGQDATLERLRAEAEKSNDYTKVNRYRQQLRERKS
jgi:hypothetical protein